MDSNSPTSPEELKRLLERTQAELDITAREKHQSAEFGLQLLDQKEELQKRFHELELLYDSTRNELEAAQKALSKLQTIQKVSSVIGIEQEESLLQETTTKDANFSSTVKDFERQLKCLTIELHRVQEEKERLQTEHSELTKQLEVIDWERKTTKNELRELKLRESRLLQDMNELEEENISLQKQVSSLKSSQIEYESSKHEIMRLQEELELRRLQVDEFEILKNIDRKSVV